MRSDHFYRNIKDIQPGQVLYLELNRPQEAARAMINLFDSRILTASPLTVGLIRHIAEGDIRIDIHENGPAVLEVSVFPGTCWDGPVAATGLAPLTHRVKVVPLPDEAVPHQGIRIADRSGIPA